MHQKEAPCRGIGVRRLGLEEFSMNNVEILSLVASHAPVGLFITDAHGCCTYLNAKAAEICFLGRLGSGEPWPRALQLDSADLIMESWSRAASMGYTAVFCIHRPSGSKHWVEVRTQPIPGPESSKQFGHAGIVLEVLDSGWESERRVAARDAVTHILADSPTIERARQRLLAEIAAILGWRMGVFWEIEERAKGLRAVTTWAASPATSFEAATLNSLLPEGVGLPGRVWGSRKPAWIPDVTLDANYPRGEAALEAGLHGAFAFPIVLADEIFGVVEFYSTEVWGPDSELLQLVAVIGSQVGQFIDRKRKESDLLDNQNRLELIAKYIGEVLWIIDPAEQRLVYLSPAFEAIWRRSRDSVQDRDAFLETIHPNDRRRAEIFLDDVFQGRETEQNFRIIRPDGSVRWIKDRAFAVRDKTGRLEHVVGLAIDITNEMGREEQRIRVVKAEAIAVLAAGLAHDLNNLLTSMMGNTTLAIHMLGEEHPVSRLLHYTVSSAEHAAAIVAQILAYSGKGSLITRSIDLSAIIDEFVKAAHAAVPESIRLDASLAENLPPIQGDSSQLRQLIRNLYLNAIEAIGYDTGNITITTGMEKVGQEALGPNEALPPGEYVFLRISDTGIGIDEQIKHRIFDPFFTTKFLGRGLGLAAAHGIMKAHNGAITVSSEPGKGSTFTCLFPPGAGDGGQEPRQGG